VGSPYLAGNAPYYLAVLFHDPPWKPWAIDASRIEGEGSKGWEKILNAINGVCKGEENKEKPHCRVASNIKEALEGKGEGVYKQFASVIVKRDEEKVRSHEIQAVVLVLTLAEALKSEGCGGLAGIVEEAARLILEGDWRVREADRLASALDRVLLGSVLNELGLTGKHAPKHAKNKNVLLNPFKPSRELEWAKTIQASKIVEFIIEYTRLVAQIVARLAKRAGSEQAGCDAGRLVHIAFALLEPTWYKVMGPEAANYVPPADTRLPTHTVFDHVNVALATAHWVGEGGPGGCAVVVDLAGVQQWISEARRLRDLWAASWLASLLTWKAVEDLVREYGPGTLIQPPARLHPFYASSIVLRLPEGAEKEGENYWQFLEENYGWVYAGLGLPYKWPLDATVPTRALLALPPEACEKGKSVRVEVLEAYKKAWEKILNKLVYGAPAELLAGYETKHGSLTRDNLKELIEKIEPPMAIRVYEVPVNLAYDDAKKYDPEKLFDIAEKDYIHRVPKVFAHEVLTTIHKVINKKDELAKTLFYAHILRRIGELEGKTKVSAPGRRTGPGYAKLVSKLHEATGGNPKNLKLCSVCGVAPAVFYKPEGVRTDSKWADLAKRLWADVGEEALCPYCMVKRSLRTLLLYASGKEEGKEGPKDTGYKTFAATPSIQGGPGQAILDERGPLH